MVIYKELSLLVDLLNEKILLLAISKKNEIIIINIINIVSAINSWRASDI